MRCGVLSFWVRVWSMRGIKWRRGLQEASLYLFHSFLIWVVVMCLLAILFSMLSFLFKKMPKIIYNVYRKTDMRYSGWKKMKEVYLLESSSKLLMFLCSFISVECLLTASHCYRLGAVEWRRCNQIPCFQRACILKKFQDGSVYCLAFLHYLMLKPFYM